MRLFVTTIIMKRNSAKKIRLYALKEIGDGGIVF